VLLGFTIMLRTLFTVAAGLSLSVLACASSTEEEAAAASDDAALKTRDHRKITRDACEAQGLPEAFCRRVGREAFDVDAREWTDLAAHGQPENGQSACEAATSVAARIATLGKGIHTALVRKGDPNGIALNLGRALHTLEDNCAHHGMSNPQHAWYSREALCHGQNDPVIFGDPDEQPEAKACATTEAAKAFASFVAAARAARYPLESLANVDPISTENPSLHQACEFIREARNWDGVDTTWNNASTVPAFREVFSDAVRRGSNPGNVCRGLRNPNPFPAKGRPPVACLVCAF
jgi:hypothetical protein